MRPSTTSDRLQAGRAVPRSLAVRPIIVTWALAISIDLFFNAGVFMSLFDQTREPSLLPDELLFRRIPFAYLMLLIGVTGLAWLIDRLASDTLQGVVVGAIVGAMFATMGVAYLWTALEMTGFFVAAGSLVVVIQFSIVGGALAAFRTTTTPSRLTRRLLGLALLAAAVAVVAQNLTG